MVVFIQTIAQEMFPGFIYCEPPRAPSPLRFELAPLTVDQVKELCSTHNTYYLSLYKNHLFESLETNSESVRRDEETLADDINTLTGVSVFPVSRVFLLEGDSYILYSGSVETPGFLLLKVLPPLSFHGEEPDSVPR